MWGCEQVGLFGWIFLFPLPAVTGGQTLVVRTQGPSLQENGFVSAGLAQGECSVVGGKWFFYPSLPSA